MKNCVKRVCAQCSCDCIAHANHYWTLFCQTATKRGMQTREADSVASRSMQEFASTEVSRGVYSYCSINLSFHVQPANELDEIEFGDSSADADFGSSNETDSTLAFDINSCFRVPIYERYAGLLSRTRKYKEFFQGTSMSFE